MRVTGKTLFMMLGRGIETLVGGLDGGGEIGEIAKGRGGGVERERGTLVVKDPAGELADAVEGVAAEDDEEDCRGGGYGIFELAGDGVAEGVPAVSFPLV
jgi:hypothetical protein